MSADAPDLLSVAVELFITFTNPGDEAAIFLPDGRLFLACRTADGAEVAPATQDEVVLALLDAEAA